MPLIKHGLSRYLLLLISAIVGLGCNLWSTASLSASPSPSIQNAATLFPTITSAPSVAEIPSLSPVPQIQSNPSGTAPLFLLLGTSKGNPGDIWEWTGANNPLVQLTTWGYNYAPVMSPDSQWIAYLSTAQAAVDDIKKNGARSGFAPANIWIMNTTTQEFIRVANQPNGATYATGNLVYRNRQPSWSPDSKSLAWVESFNGSQGNEYLEIYHLAQKGGSATPLLLPPNFGEGSFRQTYWGNQGVVIESNEGTTPTDVTHVLDFYNPLGNHTGTLKISNDIAIIGWVSSQETLGGLNNGTLTFIDPANSRISTTSGTLALANATGNDNATNAIKSVAPTNDPTHWIIHFRDGSQFDLLNVTPQDDITISPDGQQLAYQQSNGQLFIYANRQITPISIPNGYRVIAKTWGATTWVIQ